MMIDNYSVSESELWWWWCSETEIKLTWLQKCNTYPENMFLDLFWPECPAGSITYYISGPLAIRTYSSGVKLEMLGGNNMSGWSYKMCNHQSFPGSPAIICKIWAHLGVQLEMPGGNNMCRWQNSCISFSSYPKNMFLGLFWPECPAGSITYYISGPPAIQTYSGGVQLEMLGENNMCRW